AARNSADIKFNLSHTGELMLLGVTRKRELGVDIELVKKTSHMDEIIDRFASVEIQNEMRMLPEPERETAFFTWWTRMESYLKCIGTGISGLPTIDDPCVSFVMDEYHYRGNVYLYAVCVLTDDSADGRWSP
ncbi:MAG TPA: 4'-phosphopantetheinyl transferase superfamily protein, partial [Spirochaetia bacterium]|nr:4'-phosphopantetheinyl transferase superfamily protein [Spirochaetia bacterium]